jgi:hypothetical protein
LAERELGVDPSGSMAGPRAKPLKLLPSRLQHLRTRIPRVAAANIEVGPRVTVANASRARYAKDLAGHTWIKKSAENIGSSEVLAEAIAWHLCKDLGVPCPDAAICEEADGGRSWLSRQIPHVMSWHSSHARDLAEFRSLGALLTLDAIIANEDRHLDNILVEPVGKKVRIWAIDAGNARIAVLPQIAALDLTAPDPTRLAADLPVGKAKDHALAAARAATQISEERIRFIVTDAADSSAPPEIESVIEILGGRCAAAEAIVSEYIAVIEGRA